MNARAHHMSGSELRARQSATTSRVREWDVRAPPVERAPKVGRAEELVERAPAEVGRVAFARDVDDVGRARVGAAPARVGGVESAG